MFSTVITEVYAVGFAWKLLSLWCFIEIFIFSQIDLSRKFCPPWSSIAFIAPLIPNGRRRVLIWLLKEAGVIFYLIYAQISYPSDWISVTCWSRVECISWMMLPLLTRISYCCLLHLSWPIPTDFFPLTVTFYFLAS